MQVSQRCCAFSRRRGKNERHRVERQMSELFLLQLCLPLVVTPSAQHPHGNLNVPASNSNNACRLHHHVHWSQPVPAPPPLTRFHCARSYVACPPPLPTPQQLAPQSRDLQAKVHERIVTVAASDALMLLSSCCDTIIVVIITAAATCNCHKGKPCPQRVAASGVRDEGRRVQEQVAHAEGGREVRWVRGMEIGSSAYGKEG